MTTDSMSSPSHSDFVKGVSQWPIVAAAWSLHGALLLYSFFARFPVKDLGLEERLLLIAGLFGFLVLEVALVTVLLAAVELLRPRGKLAGVIDFTKSLVLSFTVSALLLSTIKYLNTGVHLKLSDLWFALSGASQLLAEVQSAELVSLAAVPVVLVGLTIALFLAFRRARSGTSTGSPQKWMATIASCAAVFLVVGLTSQVPGRSIQTFVPEMQWVSGQSTAAELLGTGTIDNGATVSNRKIEVYRSNPPKSPLNVVIVMLESMPWKRLWLNEEMRGGVTPHLEALARESVVFDRAYTASTHSDYAQLAILSSLHPRKYETHDRYERLEYPRTLIWDVLRPMGYRTGLFSCQNESWANMRRYIETPGLEVFRHSLDWPDEPHKGRGDESKVFEPTALLAWREWRRTEVDGSYLAYLNFQANHFPYDLPGDAERPFEPFEIDFSASYFSYPESKIPVMQNRFDNAQRYSDKYVGELVAALKEQGDWESTVLIVVADHGEAFYEHGFPTHGTTLHEEQVRTLFMIRVPGMEPRLVEEPVSLLDVGPTLLRVLGLSPHGNFQGRGNILEPDYDGSGRPIFFTIQGITSEDGVLVGDDKLILSLDNETKTLFDLDSDPQESRNLANARPARRKELERVLGSFLNQQLRYYAKRKWKRGLYPPRLP